MVAAAFSNPVFASARRIVRAVAVAVGAGALLAILGPFGTYLNGGPLMRLTYWVGSMLLGLLLYGGAYGFVRGRFQRGTLSWTCAVIGSTLLASMPEALATRTVAHMLWPELEKLELSWPIWFAQTATIGLIATLVGVVAIESLKRIGDGGRVFEPAGAAQEPRADLLGADVIALQMEDHYVRVHRTSGSDLVLMPLGHAISAMQAEGLRIHRSWWVARRSVAGVEGNARSMRLRLENGLVAPVARSAVTHVKAAGWTAANRQDTAGSKVG